jgi:hypothetical protein
MRSYDVKLKGNGLILFPTFDFRIVQAQNFGAITKKEGLLPVRQFPFPGIGRSLRQMF